MTISLMKHNTEERKENTSEDQTKIFRYTKTMLNWSLSICIVSSVTSNLICNVMERSN